MFSLWLWQKSDFSNQFYRTYFMQIEQEIIAVLTDTFHKPEFELHVLVLQHLFSLVKKNIYIYIYTLKNLPFASFWGYWGRSTFQVESGSLTEPLWDASTAPYQYPNNAAFVCEYTIKLLSSSFPNISVSEVTQSAKELYRLRSHPDIFKNHLRDFLIRSKEFSA